MRELALFAGAGGGILGGTLLGWRTVCAVEIEPYCREVLLRRQWDRVLPLFPIWDDIRTFDGNAWRGHVDVVSGGFPCQPFSVAGKRLADQDERNLWPETLRVIGEVGPEWCLLENVPGLAAHPYFGTIIGQLSEAGYDAAWDVVGAANVGAPHRRDRLWIVCRRRSVGDANGSSAHALTASGGPRRPVGESGLADPALLLGNGGSDHARGGGEGARTIPKSGVGRDAADMAHASDDRQPRGRDSRAGRDGSPNGGEVADADDAGSQGRVSTELRERPGEWIARAGDSWWGSDPADEDEPQPGLGRVAHGVARRVDRLRALGNGQVPLVAALAFRRLAATLEQ